MAHPKRARPLTPLLLVMIAIINIKYRNQWVADTAYTDNADITQATAHHSTSINTLILARPSSIHSRSKLWNNTKPPARSVLAYLTLAILNTSWDCELNPGPRPLKYPCGICHKAVKWTTPGVCCDSCNKWYHKSCMGMNTAVYESLNVNSVTWDCINCGLPNFSTSFFETTIETSNTFDPLDNDTSDTSFGEPTATSSPHPKHHQGQKAKGRQKGIPLRVLVVNCQSARAKKDQLLNIIQSTKPDLILGSESWLNKNILSSEVFPSGYSPYRHDRTNGEHGGVFILAKDDLVCSNCPELEVEGATTEMTWIQIQVTGARKLYVGAFYRSQLATEEEYMGALNTALERISTSNSHIWLGGDFNLGDIDWPNASVKPYATHARQCHQLLTISQDHHLHQMVNEPTRITEDGASTLDLFLTNNSTLINHVNVIPGISDHEAVFIEANLKPTRSKKAPRKVFNYKKANMEGLKEDMTKFAEEFQQRSGDKSAQQLWEEFRDHLTTSMDVFIPTRIQRNKPDNLPWITTELRRLIRSRKKAFTKQKKTNSVRDRLRYKEVKQLLQRKMREAHWKYLEGIILGDDEDTKTGKQKRLYTIIKGLKRDSMGVSPLKNQGTLVCEAEEKANILNKQYQSVFTKEDLSSIPSTVGPEQPEMPGITMSINGIHKILLGLNIHKASGPDNIPARMLKELADQVAPCLHVIFTRSLDTGEVPEDWRRANITAIFKKGDRSKAANYRPVSLTCLASKLMEHILATNILKHLDHHNILVDNQHGFRAKRSCETQLLDLTNELAKRLDKGIQTDMIVLDFSKAFDKVPHERLLKKLHHYGIRGSVNDWIRCFLTQRSQRVVIDGKASQDVHVDSGVPQGTVLGPLLFLVYINDLPLAVSSQTRLFADDSILYREIHTINDCHILQQDLEKLSQWEKTWGMLFNAEKCNSIRITRAKKPITYDYTLKGHTLEETNAATYLGVELTTDLRWNTQINKVTKRANSTLGFLKRNIRTSNEQVKERAYNTYVRPLLEYCSTVWSPHTQKEKHQLEMVQRRAARYTTNRYHNTSSVTDMLNHLSWTSLENRRDKARVVMLYKIVHGLVAIPPTDLTPTCGRTRRTHAYSYRQLHTKTTIYQHSFIPYTIKIWNALPAHVVSAATLDQFKELVAGTTL
jgi:hypothetical protein